MADIYKDKMNQGSTRDRILPENNPSEREYYKKNNFVGWIVFFLAFSFLVYVFLYSPAFAVTSITVSSDSGYGLIRENQIEKEIKNILEKNFLYIFPQKNIFLLRKKMVESYILSYPVAESVSILKIKPHTIAITIREIKPIAKFIIQGDDQEYFLTQTAKLLANQNFESLTQLESLPAVYDRTNNFTDDPEYLSSLQAITRIINDPILVKYNIKIKNLVLMNQNNIFEIRVNAQNNWQFIFNASADTIAQLKSLDVVLKEKNVFMAGEGADGESSEFNSAPDNYIDLRFGEKIFYYTNSK